MAEGYCVKDKKKVEIKNAERITMKNGKPATQGICPDCGGKVFRIGVRAEISPAGRRLPPEDAPRPGSPARSGHNGRVMAGTLARSEQPS